MPSIPGEVDCWLLCSSLPQSLSLVLVPVSLPISNRPEDMRDRGTPLAARPSSTIGPDADDDESRRIGLAWCWFAGDMDLDLGGILCRLADWWWWSVGDLSAAANAEAASSPNLGEKTRESGYWLVVTNMQVFLSFEALLVLVDIRPQEISARKSMPTELECFFSKLHTFQLPFRYYILWDV